MPLVGDNLGVAISGVNNSTINTTMTDHGAVTAAMELGGEMLNSNERISLEAMDTTHDIAETAMMKWLILRATHWLPMPQPTAKTSICWRDWRAAKRRKTQRTSKP
ncbi:hypothetical protein D040_3523 [Vibrio parahaemolyticus NIHCB0603]|nr:hypothetical protein D040_3523 [Vibrio parahaemolyticus NIHCB0603]